jgi:DNA-binding LacI/PurR family transcriptional regulator
MKLTTIGVHHSEIGNAAADLIVARLTNNTKNNGIINYKRIILEPKLIIGESTKKLSL